MFGSKIYFLIYAIVRRLNAQDDEGFGVSECDRIKGCYRPDNCDPMTTCRFAASFRPVQVGSIDWIEIELVGNVEAWNYTDQTGGYVALGLSQDRIMANTPVTECSSLNGERLFGRLSYNGPGQMNERINDIPQNMLSAMIDVRTNREVNGRIYCRLRQKVLPDFDSPKVVPLNQSFYLMMAIGRTNTDGTALTKHHGHAVSETKFSLVGNRTVTIAPDIPTTSVTQASNLLQPKLFVYMCFFQFLIYRLLK